LTATTVLTAIVICGGMLEYDGLTFGNLS